MKNWVLKLAIKIEGFIMQRIVGYLDQEQQPHGLLMRIKRWTAE